MGATLPGRLGRDPLDLGEQPQRHRPTARQSDWHPRLQEEKGPRERVDRSPTERSARPDRGLIRTNPRCGNELALPTRLGSTVEIVGCGSDVEICRSSASDTVTPAGLLLVRASTATACAKNRKATALTIRQEFSPLEVYWTPFRLGAGPAGTSVAGSTPKTEPYCEVECTFACSPFGRTTRTACRRERGLCVAARPKPRQRKSDSANPDSAATILDRRRPARPHRNRRPLNKVDHGFAAITGRVYGREQNPATVAVSLITKHLVE